MSFKNYLLRVGRPTAMPTYGIHNPIGLKFLTRLRLGLSHLNEHMFKHNFKDCVNPFYVHVVWRLNPLPISLCNTIISLAYAQPS